MDMSTLFPIAFANEEFRLLTAILLGAGFGFSLERAGFGNARKLAAQFYLYDMAVFKVMFTAILVSMVGLFSLEYAGLVDLGRLWINPSYFPSQAVGGLLLGVGFVMSGYCPGTSVVSAASGRLDGIVALAGVFLGTAVFAVAMDVVPGMETLYTAGSGQVILLHDLFGIPAPVLALILVAGALAAFIGAERVEDLMKDRREALDDTPRARERPRAKFALAGALAVVALTSVGLARTGLPVGGHRPAPRVAMASVSPMALAESLIRGDPGVMILDLREASAPGRVPGAFPVSSPDEALPLLQGAGPGSTVVIYDSTGELSAVPAGWPAGPHYMTLTGGFDAWESEVLTPAQPGDATLAAREAAAAQNQISGFFTGAAAAPVTGITPLPMMVPNSGARKKKAAGGC
jgi:uncharacterized membrane protein YedE/YeeE/rhodanese-related sulfurtransferase